MSTTTQTRPSPAPSLPGWVRRRKGLLLGLIGVIAPLVAWDLATRFELLNPRRASSPGRTLEAFITQWQAGTMAEDIQATLTAFLLGFLIATAVGLPLGLLAGWYTRLEYVVDPFVWFLYNTPKLAFYPLLIIWLGLGMQTIVAIVAIFAIFPIYANSFTAIRGLDKSFLRAAQSFGARQSDIFIRVALPASVPTLIAGLRLGMGRGLVGGIVGELFGANAGLGYRMTYLASYLRTDEYFAPLFMVIVIGVVMNQGLRFVEQQASRWRA